MKTFKSVSEFCGNISKGTFGISVIALTEPKMNKRNNPYYGRVHKATYMSNVALGYDYENVVNARLERKGLDSDFVAEKPKGKNWDIYPFILQSDEDSNVKYLRCTMRPNTASKTKYILDGQLVTDENVLAEIMSWVTKSSYSAKQAESGLENEEQVVVRDFKLEGIIAMSQGEKVYNRVGGLVNVEQLRKCFV
jgi:hypothetical protein